MRTTAITVTATCDTGHYGWACRAKATADTEANCNRMLRDKGWWIGRKHTLCPKHNDRTSRKGKAVDDLGVLDG